MLKEIEMSYRKYILKINLIGKIMKKFFKNKKVLITGNTGFKGSWLSLWMNLYGAKVLGISSNIPSKPSNFNVLNLKQEIKQKKIDVRN